MAAGIVLPVDTLGRTVPVPRYERGVELDYAGTGSAVLAWTAEQDDVILLRAVSGMARARIGETGIWTHLLAGQSVEWPVRADEIAVIEALEIGRLEIHAYARSGDSY